MPVLRRPFERARRLAREAHWECGIDEPSKIDPLVLVGRREIELTYTRLDGATARIFRNGDRAIIRVSDQIVQLGRRRFTIAHECGHFILEHRIPEEADMAGNTSPFTVYQEREADVFASEFLMPEAWVVPYCVGFAPKLSTVHRIAEAFRVSNVAAAVRYVESSDAACAVVYSEKGHVMWARGSRTFPRRIPAQLKIGSDSMAADYYARGVLDSSRRVVPAHAWLGSIGRVAEVPVLLEQSEVVPEPGWGGILSLICVSNTVAC